jgi:hypothetical protein
LFTLEFTNEKEIEGQAHFPFSSYETATPVSPSRQTRTNNSEPFESQLLALQNRYGNRVVQRLQQHGGVKHGLRSVIQKMDMPGPPLTRLAITPRALLQVLAAHSAEITRMLSAGAGWEVALQVALTNWLRDSGLGAGRELRYLNDPDARKDQRLDIGIGSSLPPGLPVAIEIKVESATNSGSFAAEVTKDVEKLGSYRHIRDRWVILVGYSPKGKETVRNYSEITLEIGGLLFGAIIVG